MTSQESKNRSVVRIQEVARVLTERNGLTAQQANTFAAEFFALIQRQLQQGEPVKVKGLGTFKIINVDARESVSVRTGERVVIESHSKVSFTPDGLMRELVNKPFSQFETVVLNDGVEFSDMKDSAIDADAEAEVAEEESVAPVTIVTEQLVAPPAPPAEADVQETAEQPAEPVAAAIAPQPVEPVVAEAPEPARADEQPSHDDEQPAGRESRWGARLLAVLGVLVLMALSALGGYEFGRRRGAVAAADTVVVTDTVYMSDTSGSTADDTAAPSAPAAEQPAAPEAEASASQTSAQAPLDEWAAKDERVRLGAYRIVGTAREVTVLEGQTFRSICRAHLGPDMECYVEVYNGLPRNPSVKAGQTIKIPQLQWKKRHK